MKTVISVLENWNNPSNDENRIQIIYNILPNCKNFATIIQSTISEDFILLET